MVEILKYKDVLNPVYTDQYIAVSQADDCAVPGLYTIKPLSDKKSVVELDDKELALFAYMQIKIRAISITELNLPLSGLYFEEHPNKPATSFSIPFHINRLSERYSIDVYQPYIESYIKSYSLPLSYDRIVAFNNDMQYLLNSPATVAEIERVKNEAPPILKPSPYFVKKEEQAVRDDTVLEVDDERELPGAPVGKKYFVCIGGSRNFQCFLDDSYKSRGEFILSHEKVMDECLRPIYYDGEVIVRQDVKYAIPGFYIIAPTLHFRRIDEVPQNLFKKCMFMARKIKQGLLELGAGRSHIYHDEKYRLPAFVHFWVLPIYEQITHEHSLDPTIFSRDIWTYLDVSPRYSDTRKQILEFNEKMRHHLSQS